MAYEASNNCERLVLEGVPRVHFWEGGPLCPEDIILPSAMRAVLEYLGEEDYGCRHRLAKCPHCQVFCTYAYLMGVSGAAAFISWKQGGYPGDLAYMGAEPGAAERHLFQAIGYDHTWVTKEPGCDSEALFREQVAVSIQRGVPVLAYGVVGPPEPSIITGYDEGGDVLLGWSFFQEIPPFADGLTYEPPTHDAKGYFRKRDWFQGTEKLLIPEEKRERLPWPEVYRQSLAWMLEVIRTPMVRPEPDAPEGYRGRHNGLAAYDAWAAYLRDDAAWSDDEATLRQLHEPHNEAVGVVAEARWYGAQFLAMAAESLAGGPGCVGTSEHAYRAAACYASQHDLMWQVWDLAGGNGSPEAHLRMADAAVRHAMAEILLQARAKEAEAAEQMELALS